MSEQLCVPQSRSQFKVNVISPGDRGSYIGIFATKDVDTKSALVSEFGAVFLTYS